MVKRLSDQPLLNLILYSILQRLRHDMICCFEVDLGKRLAILGFIGILEDDLTCESRGRFVCVL